MLKKLSTTDRQRVANALTKCAAATKNIEDPAELADKAYGIFAKELGDNPGLFKAACQVYNSCKSIHKLSEASDNTRGDSFAIINVPEMAGRLAGDGKLAMRKAASAPATFSKSSLSTGEVLQKVASEVRVKSAEKPVMPRMDRGDYQRFLISDLAATEDCLLKMANALRNAENEMNDAFDLFVATMSTTPSTMRKDACARLSAVFGEEFNALVDEFNAMRPMQKLASTEYKNKYKGTPTLTVPELAKAAQKVFDLTKKANEAAEAYASILVEAKDTVRDHLEFYKGMVKQAGDGDDFSKAVVRAKAIGDISDMIGDSKVDASSVERKIYTTKLLNAIIGHSARRALIKAVMNPAIASYPLPETIPAANRAIARMPIQARKQPITANQALFESLLISELATKATPSKADVQSIADLTRSFGGVNADFVQEA